MCCLIGNIISIPFRLYSVIFCDHLSYFLADKPNSESYALHALAILEQSYKQFHNASLYTVHKQTP